MGKVFKIKHRMIVYGQRKLKFDIKSGNNFINQIPIKFKNGSNKNFFNLPCLLYNIL